MNIKITALTAMLVCLHAMGTALWAADSKGEAQSLSLSLVEQTWTGDYDGMVKRRCIRVLVIVGGFRKQLLITSTKKD
jgi:hypothetical protein